LCRWLRHTPRQKPSEPEHPVGEPTREQVRALAGRSLLPGAKRTPRLPSFTRKKTQVQDDRNLCFYFLALSWAVAPCSAPAYCAEVFAGMLIWTWRSFFG